MLVRRFPPPDQAALHLTGNSRDHCLFICHYPATAEYPQIQMELGLMALLKGKLSVRINGNRLPLDDKTFLVLNRGSRISFRTGKNPGQMVLLFFNPTLAEILVKTFFSSQSGLRGDDFSLLEFPHFDRLRFLEHLRILLDLSDSCSSFHALKSDMIVRSMLDALLAENARATESSSRLRVSKNSTRTVLYQKLAQSRQWLEQHFASNIRLSDAAAVASLSPEHYLRLFKQVYGITPHQFASQLRLQEAARLLTHTADPVSAICQQLGFESLPSFCARFRGFYGLAPQQYRKKHALRHSFAGSADLSILDKSADFIIDSFGEK